MVMEFIGTLFCRITSNYFNMYLLTGGFSLLGFRCKIIYYIDNNMGILWAFIFHSWVVCSRTER